MAHDIKHTQHMLEEHLRSISVEARRNYPAVQEAADRSIMRLRSLTASIDEATSAELLKPALLACQSSIHKKKGAKIILMSLSYLQSLLSTQILDLSQLVHVAKCLLVQSEAKEQDILLKILQILPLMMTPKAFDVSLDLTAQAILICFSLHATSASKPIICHTTEASLRQMIELLFDHVGDLAERLTPAEAEKSVAMRTAYLLFQDLCMMGNGGTPIWLRDAHLDIGLVLQLIESIIKKNSVLFHKRAELQRLLKSHLCPMLSNQVPAMDDFPTLMRLIRIVRSALCFYCDGVSVSPELDGLYDLLVKLICSDLPVASGGSRSAAEAERNLAEWRRALALEVILEWTSKPELLTVFWNSSGAVLSTAGVLHLVMECLQEMIMRGMGNTETVKLLTSEAATHSKRASKDLDSLSSDIVPRAPSDSTQVIVAVEGVIHIVESLSTSRRLKKLWRSMSTDEPRSPASPIGRMGGSEPGTPVRREVIDSADSVMHKQVVADLAPFIIGSFSLPLATCEDERFLDNILRAYHSITSTTGQVGLSEMTDKFIGMLCRLSLPKPATDGLSNNHIQMLKTVLNIAHSLGGVLGNSWMMILRVLREMNLILESKVPLAATTADFAKDQLTILQSTMDSLFESSKFLSDEAMKHLVSSLSQMVSETMYVPSLPDAPSVKAGGKSLFGFGASVLAPTVIVTPSPSPALESMTPPFLLCKLIQVALVNARRMELYWPILVKQIQSISQNPSKAMRTFGLVSLQQLFAEMMVVVKAVAEAEGAETPPADSPSGRKSSEGLLCKVNIPNYADAMQTALLKSFDCFLKSPYPDAEEGCMHALLSVLNVAGDALTNAWPCVIQLLTDSVLIAEGRDGLDAPCKEENALPSLVALSFKSVQLIIDDFLSIIPHDALVKLVICIRAYGTQAVDTNISLTAVGMMLTVADFTSSDISIIIAIFSNLRLLSLDTRSGVRNCAVQTLYQAVCAHGGRLDSKWQWCVQYNIVALLKDIRSALTAVIDAEAHSPVTATSSSKGVMVHHSRDSEEKQWHETRTLTMQGSVRALRTFYLDLHKKEWFLDEWCALIDIIRDAALSSELEVATAAVVNLEDLAFLVVCPEPSSRETKYGAGMAVVDGALTVVDSKVSKRNDSVHGLKLSEPFMRSQLWIAMWKAYESLSRDATLAKIGGGDLMPKFIKSLGKVYICGTLEEGEFSIGSGVIRFASLIQRLITMAASQPEAISAGDRGRLNSSLTELMKLMNDMTPVPDDAWAIVYGTADHFIFYAPSIPVATSMLQALENLYLKTNGSSKTAVVPRCKQILTVIRSLFKLIRKEDKGLSVPSPNSAVQTLCRIIPHAVPELSRAPGITAEEIMAVWSELTTSLESMLSLNPGALAVSAEVEEWNMQIMSSIVMTATPMASLGQVPEAPLKLLVNILEQCSNESLAASRPALVMKALTNLFDFAHDVWFEDASLIKAASIMLKRADTVLTAFGTACRNSLEPNAAEVDKVVMILERLANVRVRPQASDIAFGDYFKLEEKKAQLKANRQLHLPYYLPLLADCSLTMNDKVRRLAVGQIHAVLTAMDMRK